jgi:hypothetical protein
LTKKTKKVVSTKNSVNLPASVRILHRDYKIVPFDHAEMVSDRDGSMGQYKKLKGEISYMRMESGSEMVDSILHEILHGLFSHFDVDAANEEHIVATLGTGLTSVMRDNPALFKEMMVMVNKQYPEYV